MKYSSEGLSRTIERLRQLEAACHGANHSGPSDTYICAVMDALPQLLDRLEKLERVAEAAQHFIDHRNTPTEDYNYNCGVAEVKLEDALAAMEGDE